MMTSRARARMAGLVGCVAAVSSTMAPASPTTQPNILYFGNSFTGNYAWGNLVYQAVDAISVAAGRTPGTTKAQVVGGATFGTHLANATAGQTVDFLAAEFLPAGQKWDYLVLQGGSEEASINRGNPDAFRANGKAIYDKVVAANPDVKVIAYETWARNSKHVADFGNGNTFPYYPTFFPDPVTMQAQVRDSYHSFVADLNAAGGAHRARYAAAGDAIATQNWADEYYKPDWYHASDRGGLLASLSIYGALYGPTTSKLAISGALDTVATTAGLTHDDVVALAAIADANGYQPGDADLDADVDFDDLLVLAQHYGESSSVTTPTSWFNGDFDASSSVDFSDLLALAQHYGATSLSGRPGSAGADITGSFASDWALAQTLVPEPAALATASVLAITLRRLPRDRP